MFCAQWLAAATILTCGVAFAAPSEKRSERPATTGKAVSARKRGPSAPPGKKLRGPSGVRPSDGSCPREHRLAPAGAVLRRGPSVAFGVFHVVQKERCLPHVNDSADGEWILLETEHGKGGWLDENAAVAGFAAPPELPADKTVLFEVLVTDDVLGQAGPSLAAPIVKVLSRGERVAVHAISDDGLFYLCALDGAAVGWALKTMTRRSDDDGKHPAGSGPWAPPSRVPADPLPAGSPDAIAPSPVQNPALARPATTAAPFVRTDDDALPATATAKPPARADLRVVLGILSARPVGRGLQIGAGIATGYFFERFQSNALNDPLGDYRLDVGLLGPALDVSYRAPFGLVLGARLQGFIFSYTDFVPAPLRDWPEPFGNPSARGGAPGITCPYPIQGIVGEICPIPSGIGMLNAYAGWRLYSAPDMDLDLALGYASELLLYGKPPSREPFSDLWYHAVRPAVRLFYRPSGGRFGALATEIGMGVGLVVPMVLRPARGCAAAKPGNCVLRPNDVFEQTYTLSVAADGTTEMVRRGYARPPPVLGFDGRLGYVFELPFFQLEAGMQAMVRYSAVFYTAREGFAKRNRCCDKGYYDRATNADIFAGPFVMGRGSL